MRLTRNKLKKATNECKIFLIMNKKLGKKSKMYKITKRVLRTEDFTINYENGVKCLDNIKLFYNPIDKHWAETDGDNIYINTFKEFDIKLLMYTLLHEAIHYIILRNDRHFIPEQKEHNIMYLVNECLI